MRWPTPAEAEGRKAARLDAMRQAEALRMRQMGEAREAGRAARQILGACWLCGGVEDLPQGLSAYSLPLPLGRIDGVLCGPCRKVSGPMPEVVTRRLWSTDLPRRWGWTPIPDRHALAAVRMGYAVDADGAPVTEVAWTTADPWPPYTWAYRVLEVRRERASGGTRDTDPRPPRKPFGWLK
jgi:hypothetical protein